MPTKAEQVRIAVLEAIENGASEAEAARAAGVEEERVQRILDSLEWTPPPPPVQTEKKIPLPRTKQGINPYKVQPNKVRKVYKRKPKKPTGNPIGRPPVEESQARHGTHSGYTVLHQRKNEPPCDDCKGFMKTRSERRRHDARIKFNSEEEVSLWLLGVPRRMDIYRCEDCGFWHAIFPNQVKLTPEQRKAYHWTQEYRRNRRKALTTVPPVR